ncbi:hypothetical protein [Kordia sp.]|uniref:hypothetical protein n=1 Tax=Kordia sp. TaxID=1965332 RepID=UPI003B5ACD7F
MLPTYQIFGSKSSQDVDVCFFVDSLDGIRGNHEVVKMYTQQVKFNTSKPINGNLAILKNGIIIENFKGSADELNNALFTTYNLHDQVYKNHIQQLVARDVTSRIVRCARSLVASFTRTDLRVASKVALRADVATQIDFLDTIELKNYTDFGKHGSVIEIYKSMAFQLGMTIALMNDIELYTKEEIIATFPELEHYILRKEQNSEVLQKHLKLFITMVKNDIQRHH